MKKINFAFHFLIFAVIITFSNVNVFADTTLVEHVVPQYIGSKTASGTNNARTPFAVCLQITGLLPNTAYDVQIGVGLITDAATVFGAGNVWNRNRNAFTGQRDTLAFVTDENGDSGPFWSYIQPTGNASRFNAGQVHNLRIGYAVTGGSISSNPAFIGVKQFTALDIAVTERTPATTDDGAFVKGFGFGIESGKYVLLYNNNSGSGNPMFAGQIRTSDYTNTSQSELPTLINDVFIQSGTSSVGDFAAVVPIGANNSEGVRRIEIRNSDNSIMYSLTNNDGIWMNGTNTTSLVRREVGLLNFYCELNLTAVIQGFYRETTDSMIPDTATVVLRNAAAPYNIVGSGKSYLNSSGNGTFRFANAINGESYFIVFTHRNSIDTWSAGGNSFSNAALTYDFTGSAAQAYGSNLVQVDNSPVVYAIYNGDVNIDGVIDGNDTQLIDNDASVFLSGYFSTDVNGDEVIDGSDASIAGNNADNFVTEITP